MIQIVMVSVFKKGLYFLTMKKKPFLNWWDSDITVLSP